MWSFGLDRTVTYTATTKKQENTFFTSPRGAVLNYAIKGNDRRMGSKKAFEVTAAMAAAVAVTPGKEDGHISKTSGKLASPDGVDQVHDFEEFEETPSTHNVPTCSLNSFERTAKSRLDEILSASSHGSRPEKASGDHGGARR